MVKKFSDLKKINELANKKFKELKTKYPKLTVFKSYLVFSSPFGQANIKSDYSLLKEFPTMFEHQDCVKLYEDWLDYDINGIGSSKIYSTIDNLIIQDNIFVEIRFEDLNYELIWQLQSDPLLSPHTPKNKSSIRIILFNIESEDI